MKRHLLLFAVMLGCAFLTCCSNSQTKVENIVTDISNECLPAEVAEVASSPSFPETINYSTYYNDRFNFSIDYPTFMEMEPAPENNDGRIFTFGDDIMMVANGMYNAADFTMDELVEMEKKGTVTYTAGKGNWAVVSGIDNDGLIYYTKTFLVDETQYTVSLKYPQDKKEVFNGIIKHVMDSFEF